MVDFLAKLEGATRARGASERPRVVDLDDVDDVDEDDVHQLRQKETHLVVLEIGVGARTPVVRDRCLSVARNHQGKTTYIRINPEPEDLKTVSQSAEVIALEMAAVRALRQIIGD